MKSRLFTAIGSLSLAAGLILRLSMHSSPAHFAAGFLIGFSLVMLIAAVMTKSEAKSR